ncbi:MAG: von Willebrand factor type A domain-containing protein, partial [Xanthomonadales bacterium]|nr:von Willebrand factor type A domain-containing protein [Xanthomonadales bacterium]
MKYRISTITFVIVVLTACAADNKEENFTAASPEPEVVLTDRTRHLVSTDAVEEDSAAALPPVMESRREFYQVQAAKHTQGAPGLVATSVMQGNIRHANEPLYRENYQHFDTQGVMRVLSEPVSTFSIDVDTGAYSNMRRWLNQGQLPPEDAIRVEEFINYFSYAYPVPENRRVPFSVSTEMALTPWNPKTRLLRIGIQGYNVPEEQLPASNLVFLIDVSGSMSSNDKLPLLQKALSMLVAQLHADDSISMVVYAGASGVVLPPTRGDHKAEILAALQQLQAGGSTNGAAGIRLAYQMAQQNFIADGVNRVILATDGDFNVGLASTEELIDLI